MLDKPIHCLCLRQVLLLGKRLQEGLINNVGVPVNVQNDLPMAFLTKWCIDHFEGNYTLTRSRSRFLCNSARPPYRICCPHANDFERLGLPTSRRL